MTAGAVESAGDAARRFAGELERLRVGLLELGVTPQVSGTGPVPASEWPVSAALLMLRDLLAAQEPECGLPGSPVFMWLIYEGCGSCGAAAKQPCVGQRFGAHEGRETRWARAARERREAGEGGD